MASGFLSTLDLAAGRKPIPLIPQCGQCGLHKTCQSPKMPVDGKGRRKILIVGESPGENEDIQGVPFIGKSGQLLEASLAKFGIDLRKDCWITNSIRCHPKDNSYPEKSLEYCRPYLIEAVTELKPEIIIPLGAKAVKSLLGWVWRDDVGTISRWDGWTIPCQKLNCWICPTWHPAYILRSDYGVSQKQNDVRKLLFESHLKAASKLKGRPWEAVPDWENEVRVIVDPDEAVSEIRCFLHGTKPIAFDYETNMLKPDLDAARIVSCAISDGKTTIAYPWHGQTIRETGQLLKVKDVPKIAANLKFEERWTRKEFGHGVTNWAWDTMIAAHVLDNRPEITGLKFQAFVLLGQDSWDGPVKDFLRSKGRGGNEENRIKDARLPKLLLYNGLDALLEWKVAMVQMEKMGAKL